MKYVILAWNISWYPSGFHYQSGGSDMIMICQILYVYATERHLLGGKPKIPVDATMHIYVFLNYSFDRFVWIHVCVHDILINQVWSGSCQATFVFPPSEVGQWADRQRPRWPGLDDESSVWCFFADNIWLFPVWRERKMVAMWTRLILCVHQVRSK